MVTTSTHSPSAESVTELYGASKILRITNHTDRAVLEGLDFNLRQGKIVTILGEPGSGKSTLLRIMAGLVCADRGQVLFRGCGYSGPVQGTAMVLQSFALFPWLTVQQNVELGLEAQDVPKAEREERAEQVIDLIGLSGFNNALLRELSGGMHQRVGIARALVTGSGLLLMDEAFSALDALTSENLRGKMLGLWEDRRINIKSILIVSHNIEEVVMMADRIIIFSSDPGRICVEVRVPFSRPRNRNSAAVRNFIDEVHGLMTSPERAGAHVGMEPAVKQLAYRLPDAEIGQVEATLDLLVEAPFNGRADLPRLAEEAGVTDDDLLSTCEALASPQLTTTERGDVIVTPFGKTYIEIEPSERKVLFGQELLERVALAAYIRAELKASEDDEIREEHVLRELEAYLKPEEAERVLKIGIEWGRYDEVYKYVYNTGMLTLPREEREEREGRGTQDGGGDVQ